MTSATSRPQRAARPWGAGALARTRVLAARLDSPVTAYYVLVGTTAVLVVIGLVMVLSASMVTSYKDDGSSFAVFLRQAQFALVGLVGALIAARLPVHWWKRLAVPALVAALALQALVFTPLGVSVNGNRNWLRFSAGLSFQPSELTKLGLVLVGALVFATKGRRVRTLHQIVVPYLVPAALVTIGLVLLGHDLGTALVLIGIVSAILFAAGVPSRFFFTTAAVASLGAGLLVVTSDTRMERITNWLSGSCNDPDGACGQSVHGLYALADGGWWGVGLGASKEKWAWLAEAQNDFIFAIIGEELGLPGTLSLLLLFAMIAAACYRVVYKARDPFVRIATAGVMGWLMLQTIVNVGGVIGLLPVVGVPLPLVSAGGSALVTTMVAMGMLISFARAEPAAYDILKTRPSVVQRSLAVLPSRRRRRAAPT